jgi:type II secretory pathway component PulJ
MWKNIAVHDCFQALGLCSSDKSSIKMKMGWRVEGNIRKRKSRSARRKTCVSDTLSPQIPRRLVRYWTRPFAVRRRRPTAWAVAWPEDWNWSAL